MPLAKSNIETRSRQGSFVSSALYYRYTETVGEARFYPSKRRLENRATSREEGEDVPGPSSGEDTVSNIL